MGLAHSPRIVTDGLVLCLDGANIKSYPGSGSTWTDISDKGNNGTLANGAAFDSGNKGSINLDGTNDAITVSYSESLECGSALISCEAWVYFDALDDGFPIIVKRGNGASNNDRPYNLGLHGDGYMRWILTDNGSGLTVCDTDVIFEAGRWYHVVGTHDKSHSRIYLNGIKVKKVSSSITELETSNHNTPTRIGWRHTNSGVIYGNGKVATARIYSKALTATEVLQNYNANKGRFGL